MSSHELTSRMIDPTYVQVRRKDAAQVLGVSAAEFDRLRKEDPMCPKGFQIGSGRNSPVMFRLSEIYAYSEYRISQAKAA